MLKKRKNMSVYKIHFKLSSPICFTDRPLFDALMVYCWMKEEHGNVLVQLDLPPGKLSSFPGLPIEYHKDGYPLSSVMMFSENIEFMGSWKKRWASKHDGLADFKKTQRKVHTGKGAFKSYDMPLQLHNIKEVMFFFKGDATKVSYLIDRHLTGIGKKISQGYGFFESYRIEKAADKIFDHMLLRPIPAISAMKTDIVKRDPNYLIKYCGYRPSYYLQENQTKCIYPTF